VPAPDSALPLAFDGVSFVADGVTRLDGVSFVVGGTPIAVVLGPNGAGKSLLLRLAAGLLAPSRGRVRWLGAGAARARERSAVVLQRPVLLRRSVRANLDYAMSLRGIPRSERAARGERALETARLGGFAARAARRLSVGEQQRVALARAWCVGAEVLFLDEPAAGLDPGATGVLEAAIRGVRDAGTRIVMATHDLGQARRMADEVLFLHRGRLLEQTPAAEFFAEPRSVEARKFLRGEILE
jgi:tungstate transport system ATP-binding protein